MTIGNASSSSSAARELATALTPIAIFVLLWHVSSKTGILNPRIIPGPVDTAAALKEGIRTGELLRDTVDSVRRVLVGYGLATMLAVPLGMAFGFKPALGRWLRPLIEMVRPIPPIAWIPIAFLWFGFGDPPAYFLVGLGAFFPVFTSSYLAITEVEQGPVDVARSHGASRSLLFTDVILPQALPTLFGGLRTALGVAWMVVITAELVGAQSGLGYMIQVSRAQLQAERVVAGMVVIGAIGFGFSSVMELLERLCMPWKGRGRELMARV